MLQEHKSDLDHLKNLTDGHGAQLITISNNLPGIEKKLMSCQFEVGSLTSDLKSKAENADLRDLREFIENGYPTKEDLEAVSSRFINYTKINLTNSLKKELSDFSEDVKSHYLSEDNVKSLFKMLRDEIYENFSQKNNVKHEFEVLENQIPSIADDINKLKATTTKHLKEINGMAKEVECIDVALKRKCDLDAFDSFKMSIKNYTSASQMEDFTQEIETKVQEITEGQDTAVQEMHKLSSIINRFDEILNEKCSKITVEEVKASIADFITQKQKKDLQDEFQEKINTLNEHISTLESRIKKNNSDTMGTVENAIKLASAQLTHSILPLNSQRYCENEDFIESGLKSEYPTQLFEDQNKIHRNSTEIISPRLNQNSHSHKKSLDKVHSSKGLGTFGVDFTSRKDYRSKSNLRLLNQSDINSSFMVRNKRRSNNSTVHNFSILQSLTPNYAVLQSKEMKNPLNSTMGCIEDNSIYINRLHLDKSTKKKGPKHRYNKKDKINIKNLESKASKILKKNPKKLLKNPISISKIKIKTQKKDSDRDLSKISPSGEEKISQCSSDDDPMRVDSSQLPSILRKKY
ncbi:unnamed protein product [Moneuplotes crassus]|uniref:Uncharacterized protein n=1 Tax=Euplotes crassus TaxID=5936 RepID=A0AAD1X5X5_EUPCR|nr:unnamed protein product [Moneuplotes crassus]